MSLDNIEIITPDDEKHVKKLIFFKRFEHSPTWHFALPETAEVAGLRAFCHLVCWPKVQTSNAKLFFTRRERERGIVCDQCASEFNIAKQELKNQGYI